MQSLAQFGASLGSGNISLPISFQNEVYFVGADDFLYGHGPELWKSDGTQAGTQMVKDIRPGTEGAGITTRPTVVGNRFFFVADDGVHGAELWSSDGTETGTAMVRDIVPGSGNGNVTDLCEMGGKLYFAATAPSGLKEIWTSDGTDAGTFSLGGYSVGTLIPTGDHVYFNSSAGPTGIWRTDGTSGGIEFVSSAYFTTAEGAMLEGKLYFRNTVSGVGAELWGWHRGGDCAGGGYLTGQCQQ